MTGHRPQMEKAYFLLIESLVCCTLIAMEKLIQFSLWVSLVYLWTGLFIVRTLGVNYVIPEKQRTVSVHLTTH